MLNNSDPSEKEKQTNNNNKEFTENQLEVNI